MYNFFILIPFCMIYMQHREDNVFLIGNIKLFVRVNLKVEMCTGQPNPARGHKPGAQESDQSGRGAVHM